MIKIKFKQSTIDAIERDMKVKAGALAHDPALLGEVADIVIKDIAYQVRIGVSPVDGKRFKPLSKEWREQRAEIAKATQTHAAFARNKSNLTLTGQLIDSLHKIFQGGAVIIDFKDNHKPYNKKYKDSFSRKGKSGGRSSTVNSGKTGIYQVGKEIPNKELAEYVAERGRPFMAVREKLLEQLKKVVIKHIRRKL